MVRLLKYYALQVLYWFVFFILGKTIFLLLNLSIFEKYPSTEIFLAFVKGLQMDMTMVSYILILLLLFALSLYFKRIYKWLNIILHFVMIFLFSIIIIGDAEVYKSWMSHIDVSVFQFFDSSFSFLASVSTARLMVLFVVLMLWDLLSIFLFQKILYTNIKEINPMRWYQPLVLFSTSILFVIPARGGIDVATMNTGTVYFSKNMPVNHLAINQVWYFIYSMDRNPAEKNPYQFMNSDKAKRIYESYFNKTDSSQNILKTNRPNVIIVLMESFESDITNSLGKRKNITPCFDSLIDEGVLFSNMIATGTRTDKGLISVLCGYPAQSVQPIIKFTKKIEKLPAISKTLSKFGYTNYFFYGGNKQFTNMNSLLVSSGFDKVVDVENFENRLRTFKWGVHDQYVFDRAIKDLSYEKKPFFSLVMTLSNHEPFDVPGTMNYEGSEDDKLYFKASHYADSCLGVFITKAKKQPWWSNTLIILIADHASVLPGNKNNQDINRYRIPMLWLGGALKNYSIVNKYCSQMDVAHSLFAQMSINATEFTYSRNIFNNNNKGSALFCYNDGFGFVSDSIVQIFDNKLNRYFENKGIFGGDDSLIGKAYWQVVNDDFAKK